MQENYYDILGISKGASADEIKSAYRKKAMELHPDRHGGDKGKEAEFKKVNEAYAVLSDPQKKAHYEQFGTMEGMGGFQGFSGDFDISDIFESFFGGGGASFGRKKRSDIGEDIEINLKLDFSEAVLGGKKTIKYEKKAVCEECSGSGAKRGTAPRTCGTCHGTGQMKRRVQSFFGVIEQSSVCSACSGEGTIVEVACEKCAGKKRLAKRIEKEIEIPAGIDNGMSIKLRGEGGEGTSGRNGDLYVTFKVPEIFEGLKRDGENLHFELEIDPVEAALGAKIKKKLPLLGERSIEVKSGTQNGDILKFRGDGVKSISKDSKGDLYIHISIRIPTSLSKKERELYEELAKLKGVDFADGKGIFGKIFG